MWRCLICAFETVLDDAVAPTRTGRCICIRCYGREVGDRRPLPPALRRALVETLSALT